MHLSDLRFEVGPYLLDLRAQVTPHTDESRLEIALHRHMGTEFRAERTREAIGLFALHSDLAQCVAKFQCIDH